MKILVSDKLAKEGVEALQKGPGIQVDVITNLTKEELIAKIGEYDALVVRSATKVTADVIEAGVKLKAIGRAGVGIDNIDVKAATKKGIIVLNAPEGNTISTAEHTMAMLMSLSRQTPQACATLKNKVWDKNKFVGVELYKKTLGIIGLGRIGAEVAKRAAAFNMKVLGYDPFIAQERAEKLGIELAEVSEIFQQADFITFHTPLNNDTRHIVNAETIKTMKTGVRIINCARGGIVDEKALYDAIVEGKVAGAALDVFEKEPDIENPLLQLEQVIATPHLGASTKEAQVNVAIDVAEQILIALADGPVKTAVNIPAISPELLKTIKPYLDLGEKLGRMHGQFADGRIEGIEIIYSGDIATQETGPITTTVLKGLFDVILNEQVNLVNAPFIAQERAIKVAEVKTTAAQDFTNLLTVNLKTDKGSLAIAGTIFGKNNIRIVQIDGYHIDLVPAPYLIFTRHEDRPGVIGHTGTILGAKGVNIARMQVGRKDVGGEAIMVLEIDHEVSKEVLKEIATMNGIKVAKFINL